MTMRMEMMMSTWLPPGHIRGAIKRRTYKWVYIRVCIYMYTYVPIDITYLCNPPNMGVCNQTDRTSETTVVGLVVQLMWCDPSGFYPKDKHSFRVGWLHTPPLPPPAYNRTSNWQFTALTQLLSRLTDCESAAAGLLSAILISYCPLVYIASIQ